MNEKQCDGQQAVQDKRLQGVEEAISDLESQLALLRKLPESIRKHVHGASALTWAGENRINLHPIDLEGGLRIVGAFQTLGISLKPRKQWEDSTTLVAEGKFEGAEIRIHDYLPNTCKVIEKEVIVPAKAAVEARPESTEIKRVLLCNEQDEQTGEVKQTEKVL